MKTLPSNFLSLSFTSGHRAAIVAMVVLLAACGSPPLRLSEQATKAHPAGTLLIGEVVRPLSRSEILARYRPADLAIAGWTQTSVVDGSAVVLTNFKQQQGHFSAAQVYYALVSSESPETLDSGRTVQPRPGIAASYGGDVVSFRVVLQASPQSGPSGVNLVEKLIETRHASGDCFYEDRGPSRRPNARHALYSIVLGVEQGWDWDGDEFTLPPSPESL